MSASTPLCRRCRHYYITHDVSFPYGCRALEFKSRGLPLQDVRQASGEHCLYFQPKAAGKQTAGGTSGA
jgi:hypothetical protein